MKPVSKTIKTINIGVLLHVTFWTLNLRPTTPLQKRSANIWKHREADPGLGFWSSGKEPTRSHTKGMVNGYPTGSPCRSAWCCRNTAGRICLKHCFLLKCWNACHWRVRKFPTTPTPKATFFSISGENLKITQPQKRRPKDDDASHKFPGHNPKTVLPIKNNCHSWKVPKIPS